MASGATNTPGGKTRLYLAAAALRLLLFVAFPGLPDLLTGRVELSTPVTSFKRCTSTSPFEHELEIARRAIRCLALSTSAKGTRG